ncbi:MAG: ABC transporter permease [Candidatus Competibacterales bacterium]
MGWPVLGPLLFAHDPLVYLSWVLVLAVGWFLSHTRGGLVLRAVGESPATAHALGHPVGAIRWGATLFGGALGGLAGGYLSLAYTPSWAENMSAGRGWIALALVVFAAWRPLWVLVGAYLFGAVTLAQLYAQGLGVDISSHLLATAPYLATIAVLVLMPSRTAKLRLNAPGSLGQRFDPER